ncbi:hypothetical protein AO411_2030945 [Salmonella enterica subsp. enterica serovar Sarajane]|nr:hypothetical protein AO411_2030945 [Salmonella enterica subsp. enterica serovar Sarajane]
MFIVVSPAPWIFSVRGDNYPDMGGFHHAGDKSAGILRAPRRSAVSGLFILFAAGVSLSQ